MTLENKVIVVTGGASGIGLATIERVLVEGGYAVDNIPFHVYGIAPGDVIDTREEAGETWFAALKNYGNWESNPKKKLTRSTWRIN